MRPKLVALIVAASLTTGWLLASLLSPPVAELQGLPQHAERRDASRDAATDTPYTEQLHLKLLAAPSPPVPKRNPFVFGSSTRETGRPSAASGITKTEEAPSEPKLPVSVGPSLRLTGIGSTGDVRTAVISASGTVYLAKIGEVVAGYSIVEITENSVTIADAAGARWVLRM